MMTRMMILALSLTFATAPALAAPETDTVTTMVRIDDLSLSSARDQRRLEARMNSAARRVCRSGLRGLTEQARESQCVAAALAGAKAQAERAIAQAAGGTQLALLMVTTAR